MQRVISPVDIRQISMKQIDFKEFKDRSAFWNVKAKYYPDCVYCNILEPITKRLPAEPTVEDYVDFLEQIVGTERDTTSIYPDELDVKINGTWCETFTKKLARDSIGKMVEEAFKMRDLDDFAQVKYKVGTHRVRDRAVVAFTQYDNTIISRRVSIPSEFNYFFDIQTTRNNYAYVRSIWTPNSHSNS